MKQKRGNGEGTFYKRSNGTWSYQRTLGLNDNGKPTRLTVYGKTKKECLEKMEERVSNNVTKSSVTLGQLMQSLVEQDLELNIIGENTYSRKIATYEKINKSNIANIPIQQLTEAQLDTYMRSETKYANSVISKDYSMIKRTLNEAVNHGIIKASPLTNVRKPKSKSKNRKIRSLTLEEEKILIDIMNNEEKDNKYRTQILLMLYTGMRMGEINALAVNDINLKYKTIRVKRSVTCDKNGKAILGTDTKTEAGERIFKMNDEACQLLKDYLKTADISNPDKLIFYNYKDDTVISTTQVNCYFLRLKEKYQFIDPSVEGDVTLHALRHTFATRCIESGMPPKVLQHILGHSDISITLNTYCNVYDNYSDEHIDKAGEYMKKMFG